ncbi:MAG: hypothetical protein DBX47_04100 [Clostridiales bacterium]|nr:MAG: hypothetical protein DBX47_04100 [Clostridiales bacterium]
MNIWNIVLAGLFAAIAVIGFFYTRYYNKQLKIESKPSKKLKIKKILAVVMSIAGSWLFVVKVLTMLFGKEEKGEFTLSLTAERVELFGYSVSMTVLVTWVIIAIVLVLAILFRIFAVPRFKDNPKGLQNIMEIAVENLEKYVHDKTEGLSSIFCSYIFSISVLMLACAATELFGIRAPTADITLTLALSVITFIMINYYGIKKKGVVGRVKGLSSPTPVIFPIRIICDIAIPVSMACRLFGNMLGGLIVMDLLYYALGNAAIGIPSVLGLYFNIFHPVIQGFIFVTLTLTFINEATE